MTVGAAIVHDERSGGDLENLSWSVGKPKDARISSLSESVGTVFALPGESDIFLSVGTLLNNRSGPSSTADIC